MKSMSVVVVAWSISHRYSKVRNLSMCQYFILAYTFQLLVDMFSSLVLNHPCNLNIISISITFGCILTVLLFFFSRIRMEKSLTTSGWGQDSHPGLCYQPAKTFSTALLDTLDYSWLSCSLISVDWLSTLTQPSVSWSVLGMNIGLVAA